jgi:hypothetical protein
MKTGRQCTEFLSLAERFYWVRGEFPLLLLHYAFYFSGTKGLDEALT